MINFAIIIPARYASTRFPGKPLALLAGKPVIQHVYSNALEAGVPVYVATDDERIRRCVEGFGGMAVMTSPDHRSGTDRLCEALKKLPSRPDVVINIQGDEPFITKEQVKALMSCFDDRGTDIATLAQHFDPKRGFEALFSPNLVKLVCDDNMHALYFSRSIIPYTRSVEWKEWLKVTDFYTHIGMYAYRTEVLEKVAGLPPSSLEKAESLEQLRWIQHGYNIKVAVVESMNIGIDTPDDLEEAARLLANKGSVAK